MDISIEVMLMRHCTCVVSVLVALGLSTQALAGIELMADPTCAVWYMDMIPPGPYTIYAKVNGGAMGQGFTGAEFRITELPAGWTAVAVPVADAAVTIGDPFNGTGTNIAFGTCQSTACRTLYEILVYPSTFEYDVHLQVTQRTPPSNPSFNCPLLVLCDDPVYTKVCVSGGGFCINVRNSYCGEIAVRTSAWSQVKELYRGASR